MSIQRKTAIGSIWVAIETLARQGSTFLIFAILARLLDPESYGLLALAMSGPLIAQTLVTRGLPDAVVQRPELDEVAQDSAFWTNFALGVAIALVLVALSIPLSIILQETRLQPLIAWMSLMVVFSAISAIPDAILRRNMEFRLFAVRSLVSNIVGGAVGVGMAFSDMGVWSLVGFQLAKGAAESVVLLIGGRWLPRLRYSYPSVLDMFSISRATALNGLIGILNDEMPKIICGIVLGPAATGIYFLARRLLDFLTEVLLAPLFTVTYPAFSRLQSSPEELNRLFSNFIRLSVLIATPVFLGFAVVAPVLVPFVFGDHWSNVVAPAQVLMLLGIERGLGTCLSNVLMALGRVATVLTLSVSYAILLPVFALVGAHYGVMGLCLGLVLFNFLFLIPVTSSVQRGTTVDALAALPRNWPVIAAALAMVVTTECVEIIGAAWPPIVLIIAIVLTGAGAFAATMWILGRNMLQEVFNMALRLRRA